jgi:Plavaka transposase
MWRMTKVSLFNLCPYGLHSQHYTHGLMFMLIILRSDKTTVSIVTDNNKYWPLYMSIESICNNV